MYMWSFYTRVPSGFQYELNNHYITCVLSNAHNPGVKIGKIILFSKETGFIVSLLMHKIPLIIVIDIVISINIRNYHDVYRLSLLSALIHVSPCCMDAQGVLAQNRTYCQSKLYTNCQSSSTIVVLTELTLICS